MNVTDYRYPRKKNNRLEDPHVVIIGAGASIAACRKDKNGKQIPLLANIHQVLGLTDVISKYGFSNKEMENFETLFSDIYDKPEYIELQKQLESSVREYFKELQIPDEVNLYDYLVLSLTEKDAIISFNWDPFLLQAYRRNFNVGNLPQLIFPHGNVDVGLCYDCQVKVSRDYLCPRCNKPLDDMPLLFPVHKKDYNSEPIIKNEWDEAKKYLSSAAGLTIFGYGAPETDVEAYDLLTSTYKMSEMIEIAPFSIINLASEKENQLKKWKEIFSERGLAFHESFKESNLWRNPRVSLEYRFDACLQGHPRKIMKSYSDFSSLKELQDFVKTINEFDMK